MPTTMGAMISAGQYPMPVTLQEEIRAERAHHVERAMGEIDDVEHAEDHGEPETEQRVERAVDQSHQELGV